MKFPGGQYGLIYADPAWQQVMHGDGGYAKSPQAHYECMSLDAMKALRDQILFATGTHCVLFMWAIWNMLPCAFELMDAWGFTYKTGGDWDKITRHGKQAFGNGYILRSSSEPFIIGTQGKPRIKNHRTRNNILTGDVPENLHDLGISISSLRREHSRKPDEVARLLCDLFEGPYLELFSRTQRPGWTVWGNETDKFA